MKFQTNDTEFPENSDQIELKVAGSEVGIEEFELDTVQGEHEGVVGTDDQTAAVDVPGEMVRNIQQVDKVTGDTLKWEK